MRGLSREGKLMSLLRLHIRADSGTTKLIGILRKRKASR